ncbi:MAG TPA: hypothetical protein VHZ50_14165, partial [Puia sp.]|nr:hypothetical protein [Puia sp.]
MQPKLSASSWRHAALWTMLFIPAASLANIPSDSLQQKSNFVLNGITEKSLHSVNNQYVKIQKLIFRKTEMLLVRMQRMERTLEEQMAKKDSLKARQCFSAAAANYEALFLKLKSSSAEKNSVSYKDYVPALDSMQTAMAFLRSG